MASVDPRLWALIQRYSRVYHVDPRAVAAVSIMEGGGRFGAVGDNGTSYGPFQLHVGGALPAGRGAAWANSPQGIAYAIRHMSQAGARGLSGAQAISAIVRNFERPAAPYPEIMGALSHYRALRGTLPRAPAAAASGLPNTPVHSGGGGAAASLLLAALGSSPLITAPQPSPVQQRAQLAVAQPQTNPFSLVAPPVTPTGQGLSDARSSLDALRRSLLQPTPLKV